MKRCTNKNCKFDEQPEENFYVDNQKKDGLSSVCKSCKDRERYKNRIFEKVENEMPKITVSKERARQVIERMHRL
jgi:aspartate/glutamate racemase